MRYLGASCHQQRGESLQLPSRPVSGASSKDFHSNLLAVTLGSSAKAGQCEYPAAVSLRLFPFVSGASHCDNPAPTPAMPAAISMVVEMPRLDMDHGSRNVPRPAPIRLTAAPKPVPSPRISVGKTRFRCRHSKTRGRFYARGEVAIQARLTGAHVGGPGARQKDKPRGSQRGRVESGRGRAHRSSQALCAKAKKLCILLGLQSFFGIWCPEEDSNLHTLSSTST